MGTPAFAVPSLEALARSKHSLLAVVTAPDKPRGRGQKVLPSPIKKCALDLSLPVLQPTTLKDPAFLDHLRTLAPDIFVVIAFRILPPEVYTLPPLGAVNVHASLLPKYRGAAPIQRAILHGETETGITTFQITGKVDTGKILIQKRISIDPEDTAGTLSERLEKVAAECLLETLEGLEDGTLTPLEQDNTLATPAPKIHPEETLLDFSQPGKEIINTIRAFSPQPGARFFLGGTLMKLLKAQFEPYPETIPGTIEKISKHAFAIHCKDGRILPEEIQPEGKRKMSVTDFMNGVDITRYLSVDIHA
ncbi:MAG: methionyl-tRNA formyltransferase [Candidatus Marinimicrobia bacterium]|nr:methionyl-tRNA formyltransferase [Candidatus Neomarinimicrobiota bacterium]